jgi:hypothetical protein
MAEDYRSEIWSRFLSKISCAVSVLVAFAFFGGCQTTRTVAVPANVKNQFLELAQRLRSFPPEVLGGDFGHDYVDLPFSESGRLGATPGAVEYQGLLQSNHPVPILLSLIKDPDPKIRTLAAAALTAKGEPRLQQYLGPLLEDQSRTFDVMWRPEVDNYVPIRSSPQTVASTVLRLVEYRNKADFDRYWAIHRNREYCADWFLWQLRHKQFAPLAPRDIQSVPSPDREMITLWIGVGGWPLHYDGFPEADVMAAAKRLGREHILAVLRGQPPGTDPDIKPVNKGWPPGEPYYVMGKFLLSHASNFLTPSDADMLLTLEDEERKQNDWHELRYEELWLIAAASLRPDRADQILDEAERSYPGRADIPLARWDIEGPSSLPKVLRWFYGPNDSKERLAVAILGAQPNDQYKLLVEAILASPQKLRISSEAMYRFAEFAQKTKAKFDRQFVDWIYAQPSDYPYPGRSDYQSRTGVVKMTGVARELVRDSRFSRADVGLLCVVKQCLAGTVSKLSPVQSARLDSLVGDIDPNLPLNTPESKLQEIRSLLRSYVGE